MEIAQMMTPEEEMKHKAKWAADTIISAEQHKKDKELKPYLKAELKEREKCVQAAMGKKQAPKPAAPAAKKGKKK